ncbi:MAG TPA: YHS domain-containing protein [Casimicrobiaceae bacterium]
MDWLSQNWIWVVVAIGAVIFFSRRGGHGGLGGGHGGGHGGGRLGGLLGGGHGGLGGGHGGLGGVLGGMGHGGGHGGSSGHGGQHDDQRQPSNPPEAAIDPVNGAAVRTADALTSVYQGTIYYFASKENRDRFEAAPQEYAQKAAGHAAHPAEAPSEPPRRRGGC